MIKLYRYNTNIISLMFIMLLNLLLFSCKKDNKNIENRNFKDEINNIDTLINNCHKLVSVDNNVAKIYAEEALKKSKKINYTTGIGNSFLRLGRIHYYNDNYLEALNYFDSALIYFKKINADYEISETYYNISGTNAYLSNFDKAINYSKKAIEIKKKLNDKKGISGCLNLIGKIHKTQGNYDTALNYFIESLKIKNQLNDQKGTATVYSSLGSLYENTGNYEKALEYYKLSLNIRLKSGDLRRIASSKMSLGNFYIKTGLISEAFNLLTSALEIFESLDEKYGMTLIMINLSKLELKNNKIETSLEYAEKAYNMSVKVGNKTLKSDACKVLSDLYVKTGKFDSAYFYLSEHNNIFKDIYSEDKERAILETEYKYQTREKEIEIELLKNKTKLHKQKFYILLTVTFSVLLIITSVLLIYLFKNKALKHKNELLKKEKQIKTQEFEIKEKERTILENKIAGKNKDLVSKSLVILRNNEILQGFIKKLTTVGQKFTIENKKQINKVIKDIEIHSRENIWNEFETAFKNVNENFNIKLFEICPDLTPSEIKLAALLRLNLSTKEIAAITFKSESGIKTTRYRLRKKLNLQTDENLVTFLLKL